MWVSAQEGRRGSDETFVMDKLSAAESVDEKAFWMLVRTRMRDTADRLGEARRYVDEHRDEVAALVQDMTSEGASASQAQQQVVNTANAVEQESDSVSPAGAEKADLHRKSVKTRDKDASRSDKGFEIEEGLDSKPSADAYSVDETGMSSGEDNDVSDAPSDDEIRRRMMEAGDYDTLEMMDAQVSTESAENARDRLAFGEDKQSKRVPKMRNVKPDADVKIATIKGVPKYVYSEAEREILAAGAFADDSSYSQGDIVTVALAYLCDLSGDALTSKQLRALEVFRRNSRNAQFETAKNMRHISRRLEDVMRQVTSVLTLDSYMARRNLGMSMTETPATPSDIDIVDEEGHDDFYDSIMLQGTIQYERDAEALGVDVNSSRYGLKLI